MTKRVVFCDCHSPSHLLVFEVDETVIDGKVVSKDLMLFPVMRHYRGFWSRLKIAYKYLRGQEDRRVDYLDIVVSDPAQLMDLRDAIDEVIHFNAK